jgi:hypothetical protein
MNAARCRAGLLNLVLLRRQFWKIAALRVGVTDDCMISENYCCRKEQLREVIRQTNAAVTGRISTLQKGSHSSMSRTARAFAIGVIGRAMIRYSATGVTVEILTLQEVSVAGRRALASACVQATMFECASSQNGPQSGTRPG